METTRQRHVRTKLHPSDQLAGRFGATIHKLRKQKGLRLCDLTCACGIEKGRLSQIEHGEDNVTLATFCAIAHAFEMSPTALLTLSFHLAL